MTEILRQDGKVFIGGSYRETVSLKNAALLKAEINFFKETQGNYAKIFKKNHEQAEAVFSASQGYLLGEAVWQYFNKPHNLLYCEALPNGKTALLVVVRNGAVFFDNEVSLAEIAQDLITLVAPGLKYEVYLQGAVPISETETPDFFQLKPDMLIKVTQLESSAFALMPAAASYYLLPVTEALEEAGIGGAFSRQKIIIGVFVLVVLGFCWYLFFYTPTPTQKAVVATTAATVDPLAGYYAAMNSPAPSDLILSVSKQIEGIYGLTGWYPLTITATNTSLQVALSNQGGSVVNLRTWALANQMSVTLANDQTLLVQPLAISPRENVPLESLWDDIAKLQDLYRQFPEVQMSFSDVNSQGAYQVATIKIAMHSLTTQTLAVQAQTLSGFPLVVDTLQLTVDGGLLSGTMTLKLYGK